MFGAKKIRMDPILKMDFVRKTLRYQAKIDWIKGIEVSFRTQLVPGFNGGNHCLSNNGRNSIL